MNVKSLIKRLRTFPPDAEIYVRVKHEGSFNPGDEGYEPVWNEGKEIFYCDRDNTVNIQ